LENFQNINLLIINEESRALKEEQSLWVILEFKLQNPIQGLEGFLNLLNFKTRRALMVSLSLSLSLSLWSYEENKNARHIIIGTHITENRLLPLGINHAKI